MNGKTPLKKHRVYLIDDHAMLRNGLKVLIESDLNLMVCGECDGKKAASRIEETKPDLVIVDISLPAMNGIELLKNLKSRFPEMLFLVLSMHDENLYAERALRAGASGYVMKAASADVLLDAIRKVLAREIYISPAISTQLLSSLARTKSRPDLEKLSDRELEIVQQIGQGSSTAEIAARLGISKKTVEAHRGNIRRKLMLPSGADLTRFALSYR